MSKAFKCCKNKEFSNYCCIACNAIFHPSCLDRIQAEKIGGYRIYCSDKCKSNATEKEVMVQRLTEETKKLREVIREKENHIVRIHRNSQIFELDVSEAESNYESQLETLNKKIRSLVDEKDELEAQNQKCLMEFQNETKMKNKLSNDLIDLNKQNKSLLASIGALGKENVKFKCDIKILENVIKKLKDEKDELETHNQKHLNELQITTKSIEELSNNLDDLNKQNESLLASIVTLKKENEKYMCDINKLKSTRSSGSLSEGGNRTHSAEGESFKQEMLSLKSEILTSIQNNLDSLQDQIAVKLDTFSKAVKETKVDMVNFSTNQNPNKVMSASSPRSLDSSIIKSQSTAFTQLRGKTPNTKSKSDSGNTGTRKTTTGTTTHLLAAPTNTRVTKLNVQEAVDLAKLNNIINLDVNQNDNQTGRLLAKTPSRHTPNVAQRTQRKGLNIRTRTSGNGLKNRPAPQLGINNTITGLQVAAQSDTSSTAHTWLFVSGFATNTEPDSIANYIKNCTSITECKCEKLLTRKDKWKSSFKVGVPHDQANELMNPRIWPAGILFNHFMNLRRSPKID